MVIANMHVSSLKIKFVIGDGASGSIAHGREPHRSGVRIGRPSCSIRPRSTRMRKPTLKRVAEL